MGDEIFTKEAEEKARRLSGELFDYAAKYGGKALAAVLGGVIAGLAHAIEETPGVLLLSITSYAYQMHIELGTKLKEKEPDLKQ